MRSWLQLPVNSFSRSRVSYSEILILFRSSNKEKKIAHVEVISRSLINFIEAGIELNLVFKMAFQFPFFIELYISKKIQDISVEKI